MVDRVRAFETFVDPVEQELNWSILEVGRNTPAHTCHFSLPEPLDGLTHVPFLSPGRAHSGTIERFWMRLCTDASQTQDRSRSLERASFIQPLPLPSPLRLGEKPHRAPPRCTRCQECASQTPFTGWAGRRSVLTTASTFSSLLYGGGSPAPETRDRLE